jgi:predicted MFS family arabinose efflux permease
MLQALRIRDFRLLWGGSLVSDLGSWLLVLAIPAHIFLTTGSLRDTGLTLAAQYLPLLVLGPVAGVFTDRWDRRRLMIATSLFRAGAVAVMLTAMQRVIPNAILGRVSAVFLTAEAAATLAGAVAGPFLAQAVHFNGVATVASLVTLSAAALTFLTVPRTPVEPRGCRPRDST